MRQTKSSDGKRAAAAQQPQAMGDMAQQLQRHKVKRALQRQEAKRVRMLHTTVAQAPLAGIGERSSEVENRMHSCTKLHN